MEFLTTNNIKKALLKDKFSGIIRSVSLPISNYTLPSYMQLETTTRCNLHCQTCARPEGANFDMPFDIFRLIIDQLKQPLAGARVVDLTGLGEPLLNSQLLRMINYAKERKFKVGFTSNFTLINENLAFKLIKSRLDYLYISFDGATKQTFESVRKGANFENVIENVNLFLKARRDMGSSTPKLMFMSTISTYNISEIFSLIRLAKSLGVDGIEFFRQIIPKKSCTPLPIPQNLEDITDDKITIRFVCLRKAPLLCTAAMGCYITYDGKVLPCAAIIQMIPRRQYLKLQFGDLKKNSFSDVWFSRRYRMFRAGIILGKHPNICSHCPMICDN